MRLPKPVQSAKSDCYCGDRREAGRVQHAQVTDGRGRADWSRAWSLPPTAYSVPAVTSTADEATFTRTHMASREQGCRMKREGARNADGEAGLAPRREE